MSLLQLGTGMMVVVVVVRCGGCLVLKVKLARLLKGIPFDHIDGYII